MGALRAIAKAPNNNNFTVEPQKHSEKAKESIIHKNPKVSITPALCCLDNKSGMRNIPSTPMQQSNRPTIMKKMLVICPSRCKMSILILSTVSDVFWGAR